MAADSGRLREACAPAHTGSGTRSIQVIAWLSVLLTGLRHGDYAHKYLSAILAWQDCLEPVQNRSLADSRPIFGTAPQSTGASVASRRGEAVFNRRFGTATLPTGSSGASMRGKTIFYRHSCHETPAHRYSRAISPWRSSHLSVHSSMKWALFVDIEVWIGCSSMKWALFVDVEVQSR